MLGNPRFVRIKVPEPDRDVHKTLKEIDRVIEKNIIEPEVAEEYRDFRGPWRDLYTDDPIKRGKFAVMVRNFRNKLATKFNDEILPVYNRIVTDKLPKFKYDYNDYKAKD